MDYGAPVRSGSVQEDFRRDRAVKRGKNEERNPSHELSDCPDARGDRGGVREASVVSAARSS